MALVPETALILEKYARTGNAEQFFRDAIADSRRRQRVLITQMHRMNAIDDADLFATAQKAIETARRTEQKALAKLADLNAQKKEK